MDNDGQAACTLLLRRRQGVHCCGQGHAAKQLAALLHGLGASRNSTAMHLSTRLLLPSNPQVQDAGVFQSNGSVVFIVLLRPAQPGHTP